MRGLGAVVKNNDIGRALNDLKRVMNRDRLLKELALHDNYPNKRQRRRAKQAQALAARRRRERKRRNDE